LSDTSDHELMLEVAAGRPERLALLFDRYQRRLYNFFLRLGHGRTASDDLVQDTFLRVLRHAGSYRGDGYFIGWLFQIARNVATDAWQQQAALERRLQHALLQLAPENRELVLLARIQELSGEQLAQLFGCSVGAVKVRLHRALLELRQHFDAVDQRGLQAQETSHEH
jgi:DNA-directed RNA polymerase specialized sigma24 family protein